MFQTNKIPTIVASKASIAAAVLLAGGVSQSSAALIFDNFPAPNSASNRPAESSPGTQVSVTTSALLTNIAVLTDMAGASNIKFVIFDHASHSLLLATAPVAFPDDGGAPTWKQSDAFSFTLQAGVTYDIGAISDTAGLWSFDLASESQNGITSIVGNPNFGTYASPVQTGHAGADAAVQLFGTSGVPEPSAALLGVAAAMGLVSRRRRSC